MCYLLAQNTQQHNPSESGILIVKKSQSSKNCAKDHILLMYTQAYTTANDILTATDGPGLGTTNTCGKREVLYYKH